MTAAAKLKVSLTLSADLIALVDRDARRGKGSRSGVIEQWLRRAANASVQQEIDDATAVYYRSLRDDDGTKDEGLSRSLGCRPPRRPRRLCASPATGATLTAPVQTGGLRRGSFTWPCSTSFARCSSSRRTSATTSRRTSS